MSVLAEPHGPDVRLIPLRGRAEWQFRGPSGPLISPSGHSAALGRSHAGLPSGCSRFPTCCAGQIGTACFKTPCVLMLICRGLFSFARQTVECRTVSRQKIAGLVSPAPLVRSRIAYRPILNTLACVAQEPEPETPLAGSDMRPELNRNLCAPVVLRGPRAAQLVGRSVKPSVRPPNADHAPIPDSD